MPVTDGVGFMKNAGLVTGPDPDEFEALAGRCPVFRFDPCDLVSTRDEPTTLLTLLW